MPWPHGGLTGPATGLSTHHLAWGLTAPDQAGCPCCQLSVLSLSFPAWNIVGVTTALGAQDEAGCCVDSVGKLRHGGGWGALRSLWGLGPGKVRQGGPFPPIPQAGISREMLPLSGGACAH